MRRAALITGVLTLLGAAGLYLFRPAAGPVADATVGGEPGATPEPPGLQTAAPPGLEARASRAPDSANRGRDGEEPTDDGEEPIGAGTPDDPVICRLTFLGDGPLPAQVDLEVRAVDGSTSHTRRATADAWEVRLPRAPGYFVSLTLDGWQSDQTFHEVRPTDDDRLELEVRLPNRPSILVVEERTGEAIPEAVALAPRGDDTIVDGRPAPGPQTLTGQSTPADAAGTIRLTKSARVSNWWVVAPNRAWVRVSVTPDDVAHRVALVPCGGLRVEVEGVAAGEMAMVTAVLEDESERLARQALLEPDADTGRHMMGGLVPGRWVVRVGRRGELWVQEPWATAVAEVVAGRTTDVRLVVPPPDPDANRTVEFELVVPVGWREGPWSIHLDGCSNVTKGITTTVHVPEDASLPWRVVVDGLKNGPYQVKVGPYKWSTLVQVRRETTLMRVEVPAPEAVRVRLLDADDGKPLPGARVYLVADDDGPLPEDPPGVGAGDEEARPTSWIGGVIDLPKGRESGTYEAQVAAGVATVHVEVDGYVSRRERVSIPAAATTFEHVIRLLRGGRIDVRIVSAGKTLETAEGYLLVMPAREIRDDEGVCLPEHTEGGRASFQGLPPDTYSVIWVRPKADDWVTKSVALRKGETLRVELEAPSPPK
jgi:hypothetical protein